jgi:hypothetical protein
MSKPVRAFWAPRRGNRREEYEDGFAAAPEVGRYAVADGATESSFAGSWARLLVAEFVKVAEPEAWPACLPHLQSRWQEGLPQRPYPWYAEAKMEEGAHAVFLGLTLRGSSDGTHFDWQAVAVGDACLFHTRGNELLAAFPLERSESFTSMPRLLGSRTAIISEWERSALRRGGQARPGDRLWMMTDALAHCCLHHHEEGQSPWEQMELLLATEADEPFAAWIEGLRDARQLRNDDVTLLKVDTCLE